jgi:cytochrome P450
MKPPGPSGLPLLGVLPGLARDPAGLCAAAQREYGPVVRLPVPRGAVYLLTEPEHIEHVLVHRNRNHWKGRLFNRADFLFGRGLVLADGEQWRRQRRLMQPAFGQERVARLVPTLVDVIERRAQRWERPSREGAVVEMEAEMMSLTLDLICRAMFTVGVSDDELDRTAAAFGVVLNHLGLRFATFTFPEWVPIPGQRRARRALRFLDELVYRIIDERAAGNGPAPDDLLAMLTEARDEDGRVMTRRELRDQVITVLFGGYEATAHSMAWTWSLIDRHPDVDARFRAEIAAAATVADLPYTRQILNESLRLYPPFWEVLRSSYQADEIGGYEIPANASVLLCPFVTHRLPHLWPDPDAFRPERFGAGVPAAHRYAHFPFGAGQRLCIGQHLATLEMQLILWVLGRRIRPRLGSPGPVPHRAQSTLRSKAGIHMVLEPA